MLENVVTPKEIELSRALGDCIAWFEALLGKIRDGGNRRQKLSHTGMAKQLYEDTFPLYRPPQHKRDADDQRAMHAVLRSTRVTWQRVSAHSMSLVLQEGDFGRHE